MPEATPVTATPLLDGETGLTFGGCALEDLAQAFGTPAYLYADDVVTANYRSWQEALAHRENQICYAVKANHNPHLLRRLVQLGAGFDIVSGGEFELVLRAGADPAKVVFSGVGKRREELARALDAGIGCINVESASELACLSSLARARGVRAPIALRVNPDVDPKTHPYISTGLHENKFGIGMAQAYGLFLKAAGDPALSVRGIACHIGSQLTDLAPMRDAAQRVMALVERLEAAGVAVPVVDLGGGIGIDYQGEQPPSPKEFASVVARHVPRHHILKVEPGRSIVGPCGVLLTRVLVVKENEIGKRFVVVDAAMNDLMRPSLYGAFHRIRPVVSRTDAPFLCDVVGPVCETGDFLGQARSLAVREGDLLVVSEAGAYGYVMGSTYNVRGRPPEVWITREKARLSRRRERLADLIQLDEDLSCTS